MSNNSKVNGHGTIKKLRTGAVVSVLAVSAVYGVSTAHANEVTASADTS